MISPGLICGAGWQPGRHQSVVDLTAWHAHPDDWLASYSSLLGWRSRYRGWYGGRTRASFFWRRDQATDRLVRLMAWQLGLDVKLDTGQVGRHGLWDPTDRRLFGPFPTTWQVVDDRPRVELTPSRDRDRNRLNNLTTGFVNQFNRHRLLDGVVVDRHRFIGDRLGQSLGRHLGLVGHVVVNRWNSHSVPLVGPGHVPVTVPVFPGDQILFGRPGKVDGLRSHLRVARWQFDHDRPDTVGR